MTSKTTVTGEYSLAVPMDLVKKTSGLSIDIGGSVAKFLYRSKENLKEAEINVDSQMGHLQIVSCPRSELSEALTYIKQHAQMTEDDRREVFSTGYGCMEYEKIINETLNIRLKNVTEFECLVKAFTQLASRLPRKDLLEPHDEVEFRKQEDRVKLVLAVLDQFQVQEKQEEGPPISDFRSSPSMGDLLQSVEPLDKCEHIYPCILASLGSGTVYLQVDENRSLKVLELCQQGGMTFHGVGALLTGVTDFDEMLKLASRGNEKNVSWYSDDLLPKGNADADGDQETIYAKCAALTEPEVVYSFGKATGTSRENFNPEDLATSWLNTFSRDISQSLILYCRITGVRRVFICGGFCNSELVRRCLTRELIGRTLLLDAQNPHKEGRVKFDFLKPDLHLGTIGALIAQLETLTKETVEATV